VLNQSVISSKKGGYTVLIYKDKTKKIELKAGQKMVVNW
jgi:hypothetical protein